MVSRSVVAQEKIPWMFETLSNTLKRYGKLM